jgi:hypothetical protein
MRFVQWYNDEHRHSGIRYVTSAQHAIRKLADAATEELCLGDDPC